MNAKDFFTLPDAQKYQLLDVRSPSEYVKGHLTSARNLPLFTDSERAKVGKLYKQVSPEAALLHGLDVVGPNMRYIIESARILAPDNQVALYCWRGGQRSESVGWLLEKVGFDIIRIEGGYKAARKYIRSYLAQDFHSLQVLSGPTGSGKTDILHAMQRMGANILDLEDLAHHRGSSFGALGLEGQPSSEMFENNLFSNLRAFPNNSVVWVEDESRMIGTVCQPDPFYDRLLAAPVYKIKQPIEWRVQRLVKQYAHYPEAKLRDAFIRIQKRLGGQHVKRALEALDVHDYALAARIALQYYDKAYLHYDDSRSSRVVAHLDIQTSDTNKIARQLLELAG